MTASNAVASGVIIHHRRYPVCGQLLSAHPAFRSFHYHYAFSVSSSGSYSPQISSSSSTSVRYRKLREFQQQPSSWSLQLQSRHILYMFQFLSFFCLVYLFARSIKNKGEGKGTITRAGLPIQSWKGCLSHPSSPASMCGLRQCFPRCGFLPRRQVHLPHTYAPPGQLQAKCGLLQLH